MSGTQSLTNADASLSEKFRHLVEIGLALTSERDLTALLARILLEARRFTDAEAGTLYLVTPDGRLQFSVVQNDQLVHSEVLVGNGTQPITMEVSPTSIAGRVTGTAAILNIANVYELPDGCEFRFDQSFDRKSGYRSCSMLCVPMKTPDGDIVGVIQLINARNPGTATYTTFPIEHEELVLCLASQAAVALNNARLTSELRAAYSHAMVHLARAAEFRDQDTGEHIERVSRYVEAIADAMGLPADHTTNLHMAATLHDIGKLGIPDSILKKPGKLSSAEYEQMKCHAKLGADLLSGSDNPMLRLAAEIALCHHEKWDGRGYPQGLRGDDIPVSAQICAVADVFDALSSSRCYKSAITFAEACELIRNERGAHFAPQVVDAFFKVVGRIERIKNEFNN